MRRILLCLLGAWLAASGTAQATLIGSFDEPAAIPGAASASPRDGAIAGGKAALARRDIAGAEKAFRQALRADAKSAPAMVGLADVALARQDPKKAWDWLQKAVAAAPGDSFVHDALGRYHYLQKEFPQAERAFKQAVYLDASNVRAQMDLGDFYMNAYNAPLRAIEPYRAALKSNPDHAGAHYALGMALRAMNKPEEAEAEFTRSVSLSPTNPLPRQALGRLYASRGQIDKALAQYDEALRIQPDFVFAMVGKGDIEFARKAFDRAVAEYQKATKVAPKYEEALLKTGMAYEAQGRKKEAEKSYLAVISANPKAALAYNNLAWMAAEARRKPDQAVKWARQAVELAPTIPQFQDTLGWALRAAGKLGEAERMLSDASRMKPELADVYYHLGMVHLEQNKRAEAERAFKRTLELDKSHAGALQELKTLSAKR